MTFRRCFVLMRICAWLAWLMLVAALLSLVKGVVAQGDGIGWLWMLRVGVAFGIILIIGGVLYLRPRKWRYFVENHEMLSGKKNRALLLKNGTALLLPALTDGSNYLAQLDIWDDEVRGAQSFVPQSLEREVVFGNGESARLTFCLSVEPSPAQIRQYVLAQTPLIAKDREYLAGVVETLLSTQKELFPTPWSDLETDKVNEALAKEVNNHPRLGRRGLQAYLEKIVCIF